MTNANGYWTQFWTVAIICLFFLLSESLLEGIDCFPRGTLCDLVQVVLIPESQNSENRNNRTISQSDSLEDSYSSSFKAEKAKYKKRVLFIAFGKVFDVLLHRDQSISKCFFEGNLVGKKHSTKAYLNLCGGIVS